MNPLLLIDFYKADHRSQYPKGTELVYSNFTPRKSRVPGNKHLVFFGLQALLQKYFVEDMQRHFFGRDHDEVVGEYKSFMDRTMGPGVIGTEHISDLWKLGYLPLVIKALPEGSVVPMQTPVLTLYNTDKRFAWLTNYFETLISAELWKPCTSATSAWLFRRTFDHYCRLTGGDASFVPFQGHDFALRGMSGIADGCSSGAGHLLSFTGTDTAPAILWLEKYYDADGLVGTSVPATEHSVMSADDEWSVFDRLLSEVYPKGIVSIVSDTYDFWKVVTEYLPSRKALIMGRDGKLVIRPDTGMPHKIICGDLESSCEIEKKGLIHCLDDVFGSTVTPLGYRQLDPHIGAIYGDSIDLAEQDKILLGLMKKGYASTNVVLGIGSFTYQFVTRDTYGFACKATYCEVNGEGRNIFKSPKTGAWKKSHKGLLRINDDLTVSEQVSWEEENGGLLETVFANGRLMHIDTLQEIRERLASYSEEYLATR